MKKKENTEVKTNDPWDSLKQFTAARIALGRAGTSIPLKKELEFKLAHAHARDAVYTSLDIDHLDNELAPFNAGLLHLASMACNRQEYLQRPDLGRQLDDLSIKLISYVYPPSDISIILADGLSAGSINHQAIELLDDLIPLLRAMKYTLAPVCLVKQARVAIGDQIGYQLKARLSIVLIGERPGLSAAESIGAYLTYGPKPGLTDESRNCVSNIRHHGLSPNLAAKKIFYLVHESLKRGLSGVELKDNAGLLGS